MRSHRPTTLVVGAAALTFSLLAASPAASTRGSAADQRLQAAVAKVAAPAGHSHADAPKNAVSRSEDAGEATDPTTPQQARDAAAAVQAQRDEPDPTLVHLPAPAPRAIAPGDRYALAGGCYALKGPEGWVATDAGGYGTTANKKSAAEKFHFQATSLAHYLIWDSQQHYLVTGGTAATAADATAIWQAAYDAGRLTFNQGATGLRSGNPLTSDATPTKFVVRRTTGCAAWPEVSVNISGEPFAGVSPIQEVRGTADAHTHGMAFEFLGGDAHCGKPWSPYGVTVALVDCPDHQGNGAGALLENLTNSGSPVGTHDPIGWPTFVDWPAPHSLTHEGTYYKWLERAYRGGMRLFVNLLVENNQLCTIYPIKHNSCDDMDAVRLQAADMYAFQDYIDAQSGGPGKGWYRIVKDPFEARRVINSGKLAVIMGIETSVPFGCSTSPGNVPECTASDIDTQLDEVHALGVRQMELVNKFDNALSGVAGDQGNIGVLVNGANFLENGTFWDMRTCPSGNADGVHDQEQYAVPDDGGAFAQRDGLFGAVGELFGTTLPATPLYGPAPHCNARDLSSLGEHTIKQLAARKMLFDPDHMDVVSRQHALDVVEKLNYSGVLSSHSWSTPDAYPRILHDGGVVFPYAGDSTGFVAKWQQHVQWADPRYYFGFGYGADINGLGAQGDPRADAATHNPVTYPFTGLGGVSVDKQVSGERVYDINVDGVAHYGLYPDWLQDLRNLAGPNISTDMSRGPEAYLQMWERASGVTNDACRDPRAMRTTKEFAKLALGTSARRVLMSLGQPHERLGKRFGYCAEKPNGIPVDVDVFFDSHARVVKVVI